MNKNTFVEVFEISKISMNLSLKVGNFSSGFIPSSFQCIIFTSIVFLPTQLFYAEINLERRKKIPSRTHKPFDFNLINELERK